MAVAAAPPSSRPLFFLQLSPSRQPKNLLAFPCSLTARRGDRVVTSAKKKNKKSKAEREAAGYGFEGGPIPDETTGTFPEAVLLRKKVVQEDGQVLPEFADAEEEKLYEFLNLQLESDLNVERMRHYEVVFLIHEKKVDEVQDVITKVQDFIREKKGRIWRLNNWGMRRLCYEIKKAHNANYILMNFEIETKFVNEFKTMLDKDERIIRHLVMKQDKAITEDCPPPTEYHTLRAQRELLDEYYDEEDEEYGDEVYEEGAEGDLAAEYGGGGDDDEEDTGELDIIYVDEDEQNEDTNIDRRKKRRTRRVEKVSR